MKGVCKLCLEIKNLQKKCHIIPEFFYRDNKLFQEHHNLISADLREYFEKGNLKVISSKQKTGEFEPFMFCQDCDRKIFGKYESYGREFLFAQTIPNKKAFIFKNTKSYFECSNINYKKFKLLMLSILWRAAISKRMFFDEIKLSDEIAEEIRIMIINDEPGRDLDFPVIFWTTIFDDTLSRDYIIQPLSGKIKNNDGFIFPMSGFFVFFALSIHEIPYDFLKFRIQENGIFRARKVPTGRSMEILNNWYNK